MSTVANHHIIIIDGGERGIRTLEGFHLTRFPSVRTRPLCDLSICSIKLPNKSKISKLDFF